MNKRYILLAVFALSYGQVMATEDEGEDGEKVLASVKLPDISSGKWYNLKLQFKENEIIGFIDGKQVLQANDNLYDHGLVYLFAEKYQDRVC